MPAKSPAGPTETLSGPPPHGHETPPRPAPATLSQAEAASAAAAVNSREERWQKAAKENLDVGATVTVFGTAVLLGWVFLLPKEAKHPAGNVRLTVALLLSFATFLSGKALVLLSLSMMGRQNALVSGGHRAAARCLVAACAVLSALTLLSILAALLPGGVYLYIGLSVVTATMLSAAGAHWLLRRMTNGSGGEAAGADEEEDKGSEEELDAACKATSGITSSAFGGLVGVLFSASSKMSGVAPNSVERAAAAAIFFTFATAILGVFVMTVSKVVVTSNHRRRRRLLATAVRLANALLLCSLACAALAAGFVVLSYRIFAAFAPLVLAAGICFLLRHCVPIRRDDRGGGAAGDVRENDQEARIKAMEDMASKVTAAALGGIMSILGGALGEEDHHGKWGSTGVLMVVLTSAFVSGFGFMVLAAAPGSAATAMLAPVARVLVWSTVALFTATAVAVYGVEAWTIM